MSEQWKPGRWEYTKMAGEPGFWHRLPGPHEINGLDPLTGLIIAHSEEERERIDNAAIKGSS